MERNTALRRFQVIVLSGFAAVSLMLAALGLYVSLSHMVVERIPKLGLRLALGARRTDLLGVAPTSWD
jgi:putative ABC transport system permease protein